MDQFCFWRTPRGFSTPVTRRSQRMRTCSDSSHNTWFSAGLSWRIRRIKNHRQKLHNKNIQTAFVVLTSTLPMLTHCINFSTSPARAALRNAAGPYNGCNTRYNDVNCDENLINRKSIICQFAAVFFISKQRLNVYSHFDHIFVRVWIASRRLFIYVCTSSLIRVQKPITILRK